MSNLPASAYGDNVVPINGLDQPRALKAVESAPGVFATSVVIADPITGLPVGVAGSRAATGPATSYQDALTEVQNPVILHSTSAVNVADGVVGASGGVANDSMLVAVAITANGGGAPTLTVSGFLDETGVPRNIVFTGSTTVDMILSLSGLGLRNSGGPFKLTASVADKIIVGVRPTGLVTPSQAVVPNAGAGLATTPAVLSGGFAVVLPGTQRIPTVGSAALSNNIAPVLTIVPAFVPTVAALTATGVAPLISKGVGGTAGAVVLAGVAPRLYVNGQTPINNAAVLIGNAPNIAQTRF